MSRINRAHIILLGGSLLQALSDLLRSSLIFSGLLCLFPVLSCSGFESCLLGTPNWVAELCKVPLRKESALSSAVSPADFADRSSRFLVLTSSAALRFARRTPVQLLNEMNVFTIQFMSAHFEVLKCSIVWITSKS